MLTPNTLIHHRYRVVRLMNQGGMGTVYEAMDERLGHPVALKQVLMSATPELERAFEREAGLLACLRHPALPIVSDFFTDEAGHFLVMQFVAGDDLAMQLAARGKVFFLEQILRWADDLLDALKYLHSRQPPVLHRDIKPQNLKLGENGKIILLDCGLVKGSALLRSRLSDSSPRGPTSPYLPLEQLQGEGTDQRSDLYALAATLYHLATNQPPVDALTRMNHITRRQPDPLRPPREISPLLPVTFANLLVTALSLNPAERPSSAQSMRFAMYEERTGKAPALPVPLPIPEPTVPIPEPEARKPRSTRPLAPESPPAEPLPSSDQPPAAPLPRQRPRWYLWIAGALLAIVLLSGSVWWLAGHPP